MTVTPTQTPTRTSTAIGTITPAPPSNDPCSGAFVITTTPYSASEDATLASGESTDPSPACGSRGTNHTVWFRFTAPSAGTLTADTLGSNYDTVLSTYNGSCGALIPIPSGCNDDAAGTRQSKVTLPTTAGATYFLMVTSYGPTAGSLVFNATFQATGPSLTPTNTAKSTPTKTPTTPSTNLATPTQTPTRTPSQPGATATPTPTPVVSNDFCANAIPVLAVPYANTENTILAGTEANPVPICGSGARGKSVWYRFTAPRIGTLTADTLGSSYDTVLSAYTGACTGLSAVPTGCNDDSMGTLQSRVSFTTSAGTTYFFMASGFGYSTGGNLVFHLNFQ